MPEKHDRPPCERSDRITQRGTREEAHEMAAAEQREPNGESRSGSEH